MKKLVIILCALFAGLSVSAQQEHQYTLFMYNKLQMNPAYSGERGVGSLTGIYRNQWLGFEGAPLSAFLSFNTPFLSPRVGMGVTVSGQQSGLIKDYHGALAYSYAVVNTEDFTLRMGLQGSFRSFSYDFSENLQTSVSPSSDPSLLASGTANSMTGNFGGGIYANYKDLAYAGVSVPRLYSNLIGLNADAKLPAREYQHYYFMAGGSIRLSPNFALMPSMLVKYIPNAKAGEDIDPSANPGFTDKHFRNAISDADLNLAFDIREKVTFGTSYRVGGDGKGESMALTAMLQAAPKLGLGLAYDFVLSDIRDHSSGSVELMVRYDLKTATNTGGSKEMSNPRFFF